MKFITLLTTSFAIIMFTACGNNSNGLKKDTIALGNKLFHDTSLSKDKTMSCSTCHVLESAFVDPRATNLSLGASLGDDLVSIADRNAPTAMYAKFIPNFHFDEEEELYIGGQFLDGRATDLKAQAKQPFLNPVEMNMPDEASVVERVQENEHYVKELKRLYGNDVFQDMTKAFDAIAETIAKFEKSDTFSPFNSKYDKFLKGKAQLTESEARGLVLFNGKALCSACHPSDGKKAHFTDFTYDNLGVPINHALRSANGKGSDFIDNGLYDNPQVSDISLKGAFRVSTLRNIAVTGPYMHNGLFKDLATVVHFYNTRDVKGAINPETWETWEKGEVEINKNDEELGDLNLTIEEEADLVSFMETLTDEQFEHLVP